MKINKCHLCGSIWVQGCKSNERAFWCDACRRSQDNPEMGYITCIKDLNFYHGTKLKK